MTLDCLADRWYPMGAEMSAMRRRWISKATPAKARAALIVFVFIAVTAAAAGCSHALRPASTPAPGHAAVPGTDGAGKRTADTAGQRAAWSGPGLRPPAPLALFSGSPAAPRVAWRPAGRLVSGVPAVYEAKLVPPGGTQPAGLAWMDTQLLAARLYSGSASPGGTSWKLTAPIQAARADTLVAAFNGGFKMADAHGGYYSEGRMAYPLVRGAASLVIYAGGSVTVGAWGTDVTWTRSIVAVRQNLVPLVAGGRPTAAAVGNWPAWGNTCGSDSCAASVPGVEHQWRSGVGVTADGALVYALGPDLAPLQLAQLLARAGVVRGMELDINPDWPVFASYAPVGNGRAAPSNGSRLLATDQGPATFFDPQWARDFITMSAR
jgi:hypothetical protein